MPSLVTQAITDSHVKLRWREPYVTEGVNVAQLAHIPGVHRGFWINDEAVPTTSFVLSLTGPDGTASGVAEDSVLVHADTTNGYAVVVREQADVHIDLTAALVWPLAAAHDLWVWADVTYTSGSATVANYRVEDGADPRVSYPALHPVIVGVLSLPMGATAVDFGAGATVDYTDRTIPQATARETVGDYVAGDRTVGLLTGEDRWCLPTVNEKKALDAAPTAATAANPYVTQADTLDKVWAEPTVAMYTIPAGQFWIDLDLATYGAVYIGKGAVGTGHLYVDTHPTGTLAPLRDDATGKAVVIESIYDIAGVAELIPAVDADATGFYGGGVRVYISGTGPSTSVPTDVDVWYGRKRTGATLGQAPAFALAHVASFRHDNASQVAVEAQTAPPGCIIMPDASVQDEVDRQRQRTRGSHATAHTDASLAARLFAPTNTYAQVHTTAAETTLASAAWPRCMAYGINSVGSADAGALVGGERFLLYSCTITGRERVIRSTIIDGERLPGVNAIIDPVPAVNAAAVLLGYATANGDWRIVAMASDGDNLYIRLLANAGTAPVTHWVACYSIAERTAVWPPVEIDSGVAGPYDAGVYNAHSICIVDDTHFALNRGWEDLKIGGLGQGIEIRLRSDGSLVATGYGNATQAGWTAADAYAAGPMVSDGTNVYFTVRCYDNGGGAYSGSNEYEVAQCKIANPQTYDAAAVNDLVDLATWNPNTATFYSNPRALVFDGTYVWMATRFGVVLVNPTAAGAEVHYTVFDHGSDHQVFGDMAFDGKHLWLGVADVDNAMLGILGGKYHIVRLTPGVIPNNGTGGRLDDFDAYVDAGYRWGCETLVSMHVDWSAEYLFGNMVYDGDTLWWTKQWWKSTGAPMTGRELTLQRLTNVHGV